ncbi:MAG: nucleotidyltransferase [Bacteroidetes bacterium HGW-Bacteroidetes-1]|jgi:UTP-glucose-1-phosphate uridylyltransferase|nr:MAG: nucleotidyltransferase [Bacteroidetes bacterium HGW-Bacteroidetes-1]
MNKPTLVIMAAGMGSRYGATKQIDVFGPSGESLMDYAIYDAINLGFGKIVIVVSPTIEHAIQERYQFVKAFGLDFHTALQSLEVFDFGIKTPTNRIKPWGTGHALLMAEKYVTEPFVLINADDFYGHQTLEKTASRIVTMPVVNRHVLTAFRLKNTLSEHGFVSRAVCKTDAKNLLVEILEAESIGRDAAGNIIISMPEQFSGAAGERMVSMNCWGFSPSIFTPLKRLFEAFLHADNLESAEFFIPFAIQQLIGAKEISVEVNCTEQPWFGVTWPEDKAYVRSRILQLVDQEQYPEKLFG